MWFEIIPSFAIITVALSIPGFFTYHVHEAWINNVSGNFEKYFRRNLVNIENYEFGLALCFCSNSLALFFSAIPPQYGRAFRESHVHAGLSNQPKCLQRKRKSLELNFWLLNSAHLFLTFLGSWIDPRRGEERVKSIRDVWHRLKLFAAIKWKENVIGRCFFTKANRGI